MAEQMRFTVVDAGGTISFVGPYHALKVLAAACCHQPAPADHRTLIALAAAYDPAFAQRVLSGLAVFDEHNAGGDLRAIRAHLAAVDPAVSLPFRVVDDLTRRYSLEPVRAGVTLFNLPARRIVQVLNSYAIGGGLQRKARGRIRRDGRPTGQTYEYELPDSWVIVP